MKKSSRDILLMITTILTTIVTVVGVTFSYFIVQMTGSKGNVSATTMKVGNITFDGGSNFANNTDIEPGWKQSKTFTITAPATDVANTVYVKLDYTNTFTDLTWTITGTGVNSDITGKVPTKSSTTTVTLVTLPISASSSANTYTYTLTLELPDSGSNQNYDQGKKFAGTLYADFGDKGSTIYYNNSNKTGTTTAPTS